MQNTVFTRIFYHTIYIISYFRIFFKVYLIILAIWIKSQKYLHFCVPFLAQKQNRVFAERNSGKFRIFAVLSCKITEISAFVKSKMKVLFSFLAKKLLTSKKKGAIIMLYFGTLREKCRKCAV